MYKEMRYLLVPEFLSFIGIKRIKFREENSDDVDENHEVNI